MVPGTTNDSLYIKYGPYYNSILHCTDSIAALESDFSLLLF